MIATQSISDAELRRLIEAENEAMAAYSGAADQAQQAVERRAEAARKRAALVEQQILAERVVTDVELRGMQAAAAGKFAEFSKEAARLQVARGELALLTRTIQWFDVFAAADAELDLLTARAAEARAHLRAEKARKDAHEGRLYHALGTAAEASGGLTLESLGPVSASMDKLIEAAGREAREAEDKLQEYSQQVREMRAEFARLKQ